MPTILVITDKRINTNHKILNIKSSKLNFSNLDMSTKEKALALGQDPEVIKDAERRIAAYEKEHGRPMSKTMQGALMLRGLLEVYDKTLLL